MLSTSRNADPASANLDRPMKSFGILRAGQYANSVPKTSSEPPFSVPSLREHHLNGQAGVPDVDLAPEPIRYTLDDFTPACRSEPG